MNGLLKIVLILFQSQIMPSSFDEMACIRHQQDVFLQEENRHQLDPGSVGQERCRPASRDILDNIDSNSLTEVCTSHI